MKKIYDGFCEELKIWPILRFACVFGLIVSFGEMLTLAVFHQYTGAVPSTREVNLLFWHLHLPFGISGISRLWDIFLLPLFIYFSVKNEVCRENLCNKGWDLEGEYAVTVMDGIQQSLCGAMLTASIFGIVYAIPLFVATYVILFFVPILVICMIKIGFLISKLWERIFGTNESAKQ